MNRQKHAELVRQIMPGLQISEEYPIGTTLAAKVDQLPRIETLIALASETGNIGKPGFKRIVKRLENLGRTIHHYRKRRSTMEGDTTTLVHLAGTEAVIQDAEDQVRDSFPRFLVSSSPSRGSFLDSLPHVFSQSSRGRTV